MTIGGVRTNFRMPDVISIGLGGGSIVREHEDGTVTVGPDSVGYEITKKALVFGGDTLTATDIAVRLGMAEVGDASKAAHIDEEFAKKAMAVMREMVEEGIDMMKVSNDDIDAHSGGRRLHRSADRPRWHRDLREARVLGMRERDRFRHLEGERHL